jgi:hypothetical protein
MSFRDKSKHHERAIKAFGESGEDEDDGLDIIETSRKDLDLSQYIDGQSMPCTPLTGC